MKVPNFSDESFSRNSEGMSLNFDSLVISEGYLLKYFLGTVADICRYLRNFNGVLQIMAAFVNSSIYRLKQTWDRISKQNKQVINKLQTLVHSDGKFKNLRDTLTK
jgi:hypothetical protein